MGNCCRRVPEIDVTVKGNKLCYDMRCVTSSNCCISQPKPHHHHKHHRNRSKELNTIDLKDVKPTIKPEIGPGMEQPTQNVGSRSNPLGLDEMIKEDIV